jgi:Malectin domain/IPT/TIG domain
MPNCNTIAGTDQDVLYCRGRAFNGSPGTSGGYNIPVPAGRYNVKLMFAESYYTEMLKRVFNVVVQGVVIESEFDIFDSAGVFAAHIISTDVNVLPSGGSTILKIELVNIVENAKISAIEITPIMFENVRINCGYNLPYVDSLARVWQPDQYFAGGQTWSKVVPDITSTSNDELYFHERIGEQFSYTIPVPLGVYQVTLFFAETYYNGTNQRVFDVEVGDKVQNNVDLMTVAAPSDATTLVFYTIEDDGYLTIKLSKSLTVPDSGSPKLNAIEVLLDLPHVVHAVTQGPYTGTDVDSSGKATVLLKGETSHTHGPGLNITDVQWKEGEQILGTSLNLQHNFSVGNHTISLTTKDSGNNINSEATTVSVRPFGYPVITEFLPKNGSISGGYDVIIKGAGFMPSAGNITVKFGQTVLSGPEAIQVIDSGTIKIVSPAAAFSQPVVVVVISPLGESEAAMFNYIGSIPINWMTEELFQVNKPAVGRFGPDQKLYIGTFKGKIVRLTLNSDFTQVVNSLSIQVVSEGETM